MLSELTSTKTHVQQLTTAVLFFGSCAWFALRQRRRRSPSSRKKVTFRIPLTSVDLSKEDVMELRQKRFATSVSVSYSNSGGVMMVGVRCCPHRQWEHADDIILCDSTRITHSTFFQFYGREKGRGYSTKKEIRTWIQGIMLLTADMGMLG